LATRRFITGDKEVVVHPIVLLAVVDHYSRVVKGRDRRVVGTLLGEYSEGKIHITNCFGVPFEEDAKDPTVWFIDHNYHEQMYLMYKKINAKEKVVGWYCTGPKIRPADLEIHEVYRRYCPQPVYVIVGVQPKDAGLPTDAYLSFEEPQSDKTFRRTFVHIPSSIGAYEAEEVGVEHLLTDVRNASTSTLATQVGDKLAALTRFVSKLKEIALYLQDVSEGKLQPHPKILYNLQNMFNLLPDLEHKNLDHAFSLHNNDVMLVMYLGSVVRAIMALHDVINNKLENKRKAEEKANPKVPQEPKGGGGDKVEKVVT